MLDLKTRILPRLMVDAIHCLSVAEDQLDGALRHTARRAILSLRKTDTTDTARAASLLRATARDLAAIETCLLAAARPFTARRVRDVRQRVQRFTMH